MSWAREIFAELQREEAQRVLEDDGWYSCEEWSDEDEAWDEDDARAQSRDDEKISDGSGQRVDRSSAVKKTGSSILEPSAADSKRGELAVPEQCTGVSVEAANATQAGFECFLCGLVGCDCEEGRDWGVVWFLLADMCEMAARVRRQQRTVSTVCVGLRGLAMSRGNQRKNR